MTDDEKREMAAADPRSRALLERTEALGPQQMQALHGRMRGLRPADGAAASEVRHRCRRRRAVGLRARAAAARLARPGARVLQVGTTVRLQPKSRADIFDIALTGRLATIESIERDFDGRIHLAVTVDDDPGRDFGADRMPGHRFFFAPDEVEPTTPGAPR